MSKMMNATSPALLGCALLLAACGGSGGGGSTEIMQPPAAANEVPDSALSSSGSYTQFTLTQSQSSSETEEPLSTGKVDMPPGSETDEPVPLG